RSLVWRTAALWRSGSRDHEPHRLAFQQPVVWCGASCPGLEPGAIQLLRGAPASTAAARAAEAWSEGALRRGTAGGDSSAPRRTPFHGRGVSEDLGAASTQEIRTSKDRVLRLLREHHLLSPFRQPAPARGNPHDVTIVTAAPNQRWGTDA